MMFLKMYEATGKRGLSSFIFQDGREVSTSELTKLLGSILAKEDVPKDLYELVIVGIYKKVIDLHVKTAEE